VVSIVAMISLISIPLIGRVVGQYRSEGSADAVVGSIREARAKAVASGWQYRVIGYTSGGTIPDAFRIEGRDPNVAVPQWPAQVPSSTRTFTADQYADRWTSLRTEYGGAQFAVTGGGTRFLMTFDSRGTLPATGCIPITNCLEGFPISVVIPTGGPTRNIQVTTAGGVQIY